MDEGGLSMKGLLVVTGRGVAAGLELGGEDPGGFNRKGLLGGAVVVVAEVEGGGD